MNIVQRVKFWSLQIEKQSRFGGPKLPLGTFIFATELDTPPDIAAFIAALDEDTDVLHYGLPVTPVTDLEEELLQTIKPFFVGTAMTAWKVDFIN